MQVRNSSKQLQKNLCTVSAHSVETTFLGQIISKGLFGILKFSQKNERTNSFLLLKRIRSFVVWENSRISKSPFEINWSLKQQRGFSVVVVGNFWPSETQAFSWRYMTLPLPFTTLLYNNTNDFWCNIVNNYVEICIFILTTTFAKKCNIFYYIQPTIIDLGAVRIGWYCMYFVTFAHITILHTSY